MLDRLTMSLMRWVPALLVAVFLVVDDACDALRTRNKKFRLDCLPLSRMLRMRHGSKMHRSYDDVIESCMDRAMDQGEKERRVRADSKDVLFSVLDRVSRDLEDSTATSCKIGMSRSMSLLSGRRER